MDYICFLIRYSDMKIVDSVLSFMYGAASFE